MNRLDDWPTRLVDAIDRAAAKPFIRGRHDCCLFACDCIEAMTGVDVGAPFRGNYNSRMSAAKALRLYAGTLEDVARSIAARHGMKPIDAKEAGRGDAALLHCERGDVLGIHYGGSLYTMAHNGLIRLPVGFARMHWAV